MYVNPKLLIFLSLLLSSLMSVGLFVLYFVYVLNYLAASGLSCGPRVFAALCGMSGCGVQAELLHGMWALIYSPLHCQVDS